MSILSAHLGHDLTALDDSRLRCKTCDHTLLLPAERKSSGPYLPPRQEEACPEHPGYYADNCGACRAEQLAPEPESEAL